MTAEITLQDLIEKVKSDLFSPYQGTGQEGKEVYPLFLVDQVELEFDVSLDYDAEAGLKITLPGVVEGSVTGGQGRGTGHKMKLKLSPILSHDEMRELIDQDERLMDSIKTASLMALRKGSRLAGEEE
jgi:hypothetical protein